MQPAASSFIGKVLDVTCKSTMTIYSSIDTMSGVYVVRSMSCFECIQKLRHVSIFVFFREFAVTLLNLQTQRPG